MRPSQRTGGSGQEGGFYTGQRTPMTDSYLWQSFWVAGPSLAIKPQLAASSKRTSGFLLGLASWSPEFNNGSPSSGCITTAFDWEPNESNEPERQQTPSWTAEGLHLSPEVAGNSAVSRVESGGQLGSVVMESCGPIRDGRVFPALYNWDRTTYFLGMCIMHDLGQGH